MYGSHPYGRTASEETVKRITAEDLKRFYASHFAARRAVVSIVGALTRDEAAALAERVLAGLPAGADPVDPPAPSLPAATEKRIAHPSSQSHVLIGMPALQRGDPDFFPLVVGNYILGGGGFVSRLMNEVREKRGLAYSAYAYFSPMSQLGPFEMGLQTQQEQTDTALKVARDTLMDFLAKGPTDAELKAAKSNLVGGFPLRLDSNKKLLDQISTIGYFRLPDNYLDLWTQKVEAVTVAQIRDAFARRVKPEHLVTVVVGQGKGADAK
jgi:zinc protease